VGRIQMGTHSDIFSSRDWQVQCTLFFFSTIQNYSLHYCSTRYNFFCYLFCVYVISGVWFNNGVYQFSRHYLWIAWFFGTGTFRASAILLVSASKGKMLLRYAH
jgi:phosphoglycerol transferase MdoB-like AlkP superfamily enzyme